MFPRGAATRRLKEGLQQIADSRPAVVKRAIDSLASVNHIDALRSSSARLPAVWALHRISGGRARAVVREFLSAEDPDVRAAAIHSVALWRDREALALLIEVLSQDDPTRRRLAATSSIINFIFLSALSRLFSAI